MSIFALALTFFLVANPIGISPMILAMVKNVPFERQRQIMLREGLIALIIIIFFQFLGEVFLGMLHISNYALTITGGLVLFLVAIQMLFHTTPSGDTPQSKQEPFIVPIATPLLSGPGLMTMVMVSARAESNDFKITGAILLAWVGIMLVLASAPYLQKIIGLRGLAALEQVMGMILGLISMQLIVSGGKQFVQSLP